MKANMKTMVTSRKITERLNLAIVKNILFIHAWSGCDTTSAIFNKGKTALMKLIAKWDRKVLDIICFTFNNTHVTLEEIGKAEVKLFVTTYGMYYESS